ncbi:MAG: tyrosine--tRNA ligase [Planctomycetota bacterium]|jgi:tyrosyl-tRNA synthetase
MTTTQTISFLDELAWRGLLHQVTDESAIRKRLASPGQVTYCGFDPSCGSLTIGNFIQIKLLMHWQACGHQPIVLMGGGTGLIGDPSGKDEERQLLTRAEVEANVATQRPIYERLLDFDPARPNAAVLVNNIDWLEPMGFIDVLRDVGKHFSVNEMIQRESVKWRLEEREHGISYTEFSYMILQAYDFLHLRRTMDCHFQTAGSDQFGNIVSGIDLIRREFGHEQAEAYGITSPLVTRSDGKKIGKTEQGAVWLTADRTSPYAFYQYWVNVPDDDVGRFLRFFTMLPREAIEALEQEQVAAAHQRPGQRALAREMTRLLHGADALQGVEVASEALFTGRVRELDDSMLTEVFADVPHSTHDRAALEGEGMSLLELLPGTSLAASKREARQFLGDGAVAVNGERADGDARLRTSDLLHGRTILLRRGKKKWHATQWG